MQPEKNPFEGDMYAQQEDRQDAPIRPEETNMINELLRDPEMQDDEVKKEFFWVFARDNSLTFLDPERKEDKLINFDIIKISALNSTPYYDYSFKKELQWNIMRNVYETKLDRSTGVKNAQGMKNERIVQQSQFAEQRSISEDGGSGAKDGFLKRLLGRSR